MPCAYRIYLVQAYITSRLESVESGGGGGADVDLLDQEDALAEQLDALPYLLRFQYERSAAYLASIVDPRVEAYKQVRGPRTLCACNAMLWNTQCGDLRSFPACIPPVCQNAWCFSAIGITSKLAGV